jgi:hypothetical protein
MLLAHKDLGNPNPNPPEKSARGAESSRCFVKKAATCRGKVERERIKEVKKKERKEKAERLAASRAEKQRQ